MSALNSDCFDFKENPAKAQKWMDEARGFSVDAAGMGVFNGGITNPMRDHLRIGNRYYRFVSANMSQERKIGGVWWIEHETLMHIYQRFRQIGANDRTAHSIKSKPSSTVFREWLALTFDWNLIEEVLYCHLADRIDGYIGAGRVASGSHVMDKRGYGYAPHLYNLFSIKQICIPELWVHQPKAFPNIKIIPYSKLESLL